jgi:microcystin-dependent protein
MPYITLRPLVFAGVSSTAYVPPSSPTGMAATASATEANISWTAVASSAAAPVVGYRVFINGTLKCQTTTTQCLAGSLDADTEYSAQVAAYGPSGQGALSTAYAFTTMGPVAAADFVWPSASSMRITWQPPTRTGGAISAYTLRYRESGISTWTEQLNATSPALLSALNPSKAYEVTLAGTNAVGPGPQSSTLVSAIPAVPAAPRSLTTAAAASSTQLTWLAPSTDAVLAPLFEYEVSVFAADGSAATAVTGATTRRTGSTATSFAFTGLVNGETYRFDVRAVNAAGAGAPATANFSLPALPAAAIAAYTGAATPSGWLEADGSPVSRSQYPELFTAIGTTYGAGNGSTTFNLPDLRGRTSVNLASGQADFDTLGETGGVATHALTATEMPTHSHGTAASAGAHAHAGATGSVNRNASHGHGLNIGATRSGASEYIDTTNYFAGGTSIDNEAYGTNTYSMSKSSYLTSTNTDHAHSLSSAGTHAHTIAAAGSSSAHNNLQPYLTLRWLIAVAKSSDLTAGFVLQSTAAALPGTLNLDGATVSRTTNAVLFAATGTAFGVGDGSTTFNLPNAQGRLIVGLSSAAMQHDTLGETGGSKTQTLSLADVPSHTHTMDTAANHTHGGTTATMNQNTTHGHGINIGATRSGSTEYLDTVSYFAGGMSAQNESYGTNTYSVSRYTQIASTDINHEHTLPQDAGHAHTLAAVGANTAHENLMPYHTVRFLVTTAPFSTSSADIRFFSAAAAVPSGWTAEATTAGRALVGISAADTEFDTLAEQGGAKTVTLTTANLPSTHDHGAAAATAGVHNHTAGSMNQNATHNHGINIGTLMSGASQYIDTVSYFAGGTSGQNEAYGTNTLSMAKSSYLSTTDTNHVHGVSSDGAHTHATTATGSSAAHQNLKPYAVLRLLERTIVQAAPAGAASEVAFVTAAPAAASFAWTTMQARALWFHPRKRTLPTYHAVLAI